MRPSSFPPSLPTRDKGPRGPGLGCHPVNKNRNLPFSHPPRKHSYLPLPDRSSILLYTVSKHFFFRRKNLRIPVSLIKKEPLLPYSFLPFSSCDQKPSPSPSSSQYSIFFHTMNVSLFSGLERVELRIEYSRKKSPLFRLLHHFTFEAIPSFP